MPRIDLMDTGFAHWRIWAAKLRDENSNHSENAKILCRLLDIYEALNRRAAFPNSANNLTDNLLGCIEQLIGRMLTSGAEPPNEAAVLR